MPRVTLQTLADDLGVSRSTVSNAFGRPDQLSRELRERILARARELHFTGPDPMARGLRRGRVGAVGVLVDQSLSYAFSDPAMVTYLDGLALDLQTDGLGILLHSVSGMRSDAELVRGAAVDAWVVASLPAGDPAVAAAREQHRPMVVLDQPSLPGVPVMRIDDEGGARTAAGHLLGLGHRRIGVLTPPLQPDGYQGVVDTRRHDRASYEVMAHRLNGVRAAVRAAGLAWPDVPVVECAVNDVDTGALGAWELFDRGEPPTGVVALSDQLAIGALRAAFELGVPVPHSVSVTGFDDVAAAATTQPPLTTVAQPLRQRGTTAGALVRTLLAGGQVPPQPRLTLELVVRESTGPAPAGS